MKIIVGLSGGVDSSVCALLLQQQGYQVEALFMKNWEEDDNETCSAQQDLKDASAIAKKLNIKLHTVNFSSEYWQEVFEDFIEQHKNGLTPNPDVLCNQKIKFKVFLEYALELGANKIATGHYAQITTDNQLKVAVDNNKDQSYFLHLLNEYQLSKSIFPLGGMNKTEVRALAQKHNLITANKKDSTGICFIGEKHFQSFLSQYLPIKEGDMIDKYGNFIKKHQGVAFYTIGQRKGLGIGGGFGKGNEPWFVADKNITTNELIVVQGDDRLLYHSIIKVDAIHWINKEPQLPVSFEAKIRYRQKNQKCTLEIVENGYKISFSTPQRAVTKGQSIVFYQDDICLGGGIIKERY
ncbi:tRNA-specific 2-thiouridylase MnmA [hydrothermal vent metagenome]|uniref:tRNA-specific 2-thiouridylase MnmA n=1 Tax=hydrothermal vent metagenome TaxID=652676 RepID=A0A1W1C870_9ZZZZ